ncbi:MAG: hypothetical protein AAF443_07520 [Chlamydiota bacterium]
MEIHNSYNSVINSHSANQKAPSHGSVYGVDIATFIGRISRLDNNALPLTQRHIEHRKSDSLSKQLVLYLGVRS